MITINDIYKINQSLERLKGLMEISLINIESAKSENNHSDVLYYEHDLNDLKIKYLYVLKKYSVLFN